MDHAQQARPRPLTSATQTNSAAHNFAFFGNPVKQATTKTGHQRVVLFSSLLRGLQMRRHARSASALFYLALPQLRQFRQSLRLIERAECQMMRAVTVCDRISDNESAPVDATPPKRRCLSVAACSKGGRSQSAIATVTQANDGETTTLAVRDSSNVT